MMFGSWVQQFTSGRELYLSHCTKAQYSYHLNIGKSSSYTSKFVSDNHSKTKRFTVLIFFLSVHKYCVVFSLKVCSTVFSNQLPKQYLLFWNVIGCYYSQVKNNKGW